MTEEQGREPTFSVSASPGVSRFTMELEQLAHGVWRLTLIDGSGRRHVALRELDLVHLRDLCSRVIEQSRIPPF